MRLPTRLKRSCAIAATLSTFGLTTYLPAADDTSDANDVATDNKQVAVDNKNLEAITQPAGTGIFSRVPFRVSVGVRAGYDDNVYTTSVDKHGSGFLNGNIDLNYDFGSARTKLSLDAGIGGTYYFDRPGEQSVDPNLSLGLSLTHRATPRLTLAASVLAAYQAEPSFQFAGTANRRVGNYFYTLDKFSVAYLWAPRFSTATSYSLGVIHYDNSSVGDFENRFEHTFGQEFRFLWLPTTTLVAEYRFEYVDYQDIGRDSTTHFVLGGIDHSFSPRLNASFRAGGEFRHYEQEDIDRSSPYFESTVTYALGQRTSLSWSNRYSIEEPNVADSPSRKTFRTGLEAKYGVTSRVSVSLGTYYEHDMNEGVDTATVVSPEFDEDSFDIALTVRYAITRYLQVEAGYTHTEVWSDIALREYSRNRVYGGLQLTF